MPKIQYIYEEIEIPISITRSIIPFEEKPENLGFKQLCLDLSRMNMTFMGRAIHPTIDYKSQSQLLNWLDRALTQSGRKFLCKVHDQTEVGIQRFYLHHLSTRENFGLMTPKYSANYSYSVLNQTLTLEVISKELKGVSFDNPDGEKYIAEKNAYIRTITKYKMLNNEIKTLRKFFTNSGVIAGGIIHDYLEDIRYGDIKLNDEKNGSFVKLYCLHHARLLALKNKKIVNHSFFMFQSTKKAILKNKQMIETYEKLRNEIQKEDITPIIQNIIASGSVCAATMPHKTRHDG